MLCDRTKKKRTSRGLEPRTFWCPGRRPEPFRLEGTLNLRLAAECIITDANNNQRENPWDGIFHMYERETRKKFNEENEQNNPNTI
jgi:hypothetical protein